jgi:hypothetical protein
MSRNLASPIWPTHRRKRRAARANRRRLLEAQRVAQRQAHARQVSR